MSADEIESFIYTVDWGSGYRDRVDRSQRRVRDKEYEDRYQINTDLGLRFGEVRAPTGVVQGQNMLRVLRETTGNLGRFDSFDDLAIPYRSVATDILALEEVVLGNGYLVDAMMASMSVPGALPPYKLNGHMLVDGGVVNNMPVDVARAMGLMSLLPSILAPITKPKMNLRGCLLSRTNSLTISFVVVHNSKWTSLNLKISIFVPMWAPWKPSSSTKCLGLFKLGTILPSN